MKLLPLLPLALLTLACSAEQTAKTPAPEASPQSASKAAPESVSGALTQEQVGVRVIHEILHGDTASVAKYFEDSVGPSLTRETLEAIRGQISWLSGLIGDSLDPFMTGYTPDSAHADSVFFREYRLASESNKRSPLIVAHVWFGDSVTDKAAGAYVKTFLESEKRLGDEQVWTVGGKEVDIHSVVLIEFQQGRMLAVKIYDTDTAALSKASATARAVPIIREVLARGYLEKAKGELQGQTLLESIGVAFIRKDPRYGYNHYKYAIEPEDYLPPGKRPKTGKRPAAPKPKESKSAPR